MKNSKPIFILKNEVGKEQRYTLGDQGQLVPLVAISEEKVSWQSVNTISETCKILKLGRNTLMSLIKSGQLKAVKAGIKRWIVPGWAIEDFLQRPKQGV
ncbi:MULTISPECIES: helix-turn-helix domain-containing protein [Pelosinus]|uniref:Helix-turn-helix domain-containing protein n=1 Tax=Pelosinus fermentans B4 TaxID=1149862 RepID=I9LG94_9FIRM|nr:MULTISPECIES: helix-turn-helix domain-containing protein [Pelosinus]EIW19514.1 hypothetical protein FB4_2697 [Pelosinus fermentans B4]EIW24753.1 hypothetical protein FA11_3144 [Pelosinus fermentans A11]OAM95966.1 hypothetical protein FR7_03988 [Pelosinus fermentans DSM 17108]SDR34843.1 DNA binding domain-containing protein, excisionase family [Pelosinus fermentans]